MESLKIIYLSTTGFMMTVTFMLSIGAGKGKALKVSVIGLKLCALWPLLALVKTLPKAKSRPLNRLSSKARREMNSSRFK